jgi:hypothetical protein
MDAALQKRASNGFDLKSSTPSRDKCYPQEEILGPLVIRSFAVAPSSMTPNKVVYGSFILLLLLVLNLGQGFVMHGAPGTDCYQCCIRLGVRLDNKHLLKKGDYPSPGFLLITLVHTLSTISFLLLYSLEA